jgi:protein SCO1
MKLHILCLGVLAFLSCDRASIASGQEAKPRTPHADRLDATYRGGLVAPPLPKPRFVLTDTSGAPFDFWKRTQGSVALLFFGYTYCPDQCPMHMANIGAALKKIPAGIADQVKLVFVTTDPARDVPAVLRRWLDPFDKRFIGLTGTEAAIEAVQKSAGVPLAQRTGVSNGTYGVAHANFVLAYTKDNLAHVIYPGGVSKDDWVHDLPLLINETWPTQMPERRQD